MFEFCNPAMNSSRRLVGTLIRNNSSSANNCIWNSIRSYYTNMSGKANLYSKISPLGDRGTSLTPELDGWVEKGNKVSFAELQRIIRDLRKRKRFGQALEVSEWMNRRGICVFSPANHAVQLDLIGRVHGFISAESYFNKLGDKDKTYKTYGALLNCYVRQRQTDKSLSHLQKMKDMGFATSALTYNNIMCLYTNIGQHEKIPDVLSEMKKSKVSPDNYSYRICINSYGVRSDIEGMEIFLKEMESQLEIVVDWTTYAVVANIYIKTGQREKAVDTLRKAEARLDNKDGVGYNHLISLYASLRNKADVLRLWELEKSACKRCINRDYIAMVDSLVNMGELEEAEKVLKEWEAAGNCYDFRVPNRVILAYCKGDLIEKAEAMLEDLMEKDRATAPNSWFRVAEGYLARGSIDKATAVLKLALSLRAGSKGKKPLPTVMAGILSWLCDSGNIDEVQAFVNSLRTVIPMNRQMYHAMLKASIRNLRKVEVIQAGMKADNINEDEETRSILNLMGDKC